MFFLRRMTLSKEEKIQGKNAHSKHLMGYFSAKAKARFPQPLPSSYMSPFLGMERIACFALLELGIGEMPRRTVSTATLNKRIEIRRMKKVLNM